MKKKVMIPLALIACVLWASAFPTLKTLYILLDIGTDVGVKLQLAGTRFSIAGLVILIFYTIRFKQLPFQLKGKQWLQVLLLGLIQTSIMYTMFYIGVYNTTGVKSSILSQGSTFLIVILAHFIYHDDKLHRGKIIGLILGFSGILLVNFNSISLDQKLLEFSLFGEGFMLLSGIFSATGTFYAKRLSKTLKPILMTGWQLTFGGLMLLIVGLNTAQEQLVFDDPMSVILLGYSVLISAGAFTLWFTLLQKNKASELSMIKFSIPVLGAIFSALLLDGENFSVFVVVALIMVAFGIYQCNREPEKS